MMPSDCRDGLADTFEANLEPGYGCWAYAYENCELWIENITIISDDYITEIKTGWNIVGVLHNENVSKEFILRALDNV